MYDLELNNTEVPQNKTNMGATSAKDRHSVFIKFKGYDVILSVLSVLILTRPTL